MNAAFRDAEAGLRRARAETAFVAAVAPVREWSSDMAAEAPQIPEADPMPAAPDVRGLVDPLADTALATVGTNPGVAKGTASERGATAARDRSPRPGRRARPGITGRFATDRQSADASASDRAEARKPAQSRSRVALLLARYDHLRAALDELGVSRMQWDVARPSARNIVPMPPRRAAGGTSGQAGRTQPSRVMAGAIARWNELMSRSATDRGDVAADFDAAEQTSRAPWLPRDEPYRPAFVPHDAGILPEHASLGFEPPRPAETLRLGNLTGSRGSTRPDAVAPPAAAPGPVAPPGMPIVADAQHVPLGRVFDALARIEQQIASRGHQAEPATQWYDDDDGLVARIHDILRRQVERHGIDLR